MNDLLPSWLYKLWPWLILFMATGYACLGYWSAATGLSIWAVGILIIRKRNKNDRITIARRAARRR